MAGVTLPCFFISLPQAIFVIGQPVPLVKNCKQGLESAALALRPRVVFSSLRSQFFSKLACKLVCLRTFVIGLLAVYVTDLLRTTFC